MKGLNKNRLLKVLNVFHDRLCELSKPIPGSGDIMLTLFSFATLFTISFSTPQGTQIALLIGGGEDARVLTQALSWWQAEPNAPMPLIQTAQPGPIDLKQGLRVLPNEIAPKLTVPQLLIVAHEQEQPMNDLMMAHIRHCLLKGVPIWVVGPFPDAFLELPLNPGQRIERVAVEALSAKIRDFCQ